MRIGLQDNFAGTPELNDLIYLRIAEIDLQSGKNVGKIDSERLNFVSVDLKVANG